MHNDDARTYERCLKLREIHSIVYTFNTSEQSNGLSTCRNPMHRMYQKCKSDTQLRQRTSYGCIEGVWRVCRCEEAISRACTAIWQSGMLTYACEVYVGCPDNGMRIGRTCNSKSKKSNNNMSKWVAKFRQLGSKMVSTHFQRAKIHSDTQKGNFFLAGTPMGTPADPIKRLPRRLQNRVDVLFRGMCLLASASHRI